MVILWVPSQQNYHNFHVNPDAKKLISLLHQFDLIQHVNVPTHTAGNTLDLVISKDDLLVRDISTDLSVRSDHFAVLFTLSFPSPGLPKQTVTYRSWKSVDHDQLRNDIGEAFSDFTCSDVESAVHNYNEVLQHIVDKHAPEKTRVVTIRPDAPWYNSKLAEEKRLKRKYERKYNRSQLAIDGELYCHQRDKYNNLLNTTKQDYFKNKVESATSTKELFKVCNNLLNRTNENVSPSHNCGTELANRFVNYFGDKIKSIRQDLENSSNTPDYTTNVASDFDGVPLEKFRIVHQGEVRKIITSSPSKSCALDPIPTSILKLCLDELTPVLTLIVNTSLKFADFSPELKRAFILPLLKKGHTWLWNFKELSACFEPVLSIKTRWTHCMCAAWGSSESSQSVWSFSISLSPTAQHWDSPPSCPEWPPSGSRHSWRSNTGFTRSQCCIWHDWPPPTTSYTGVIIWHPR